MSELDPDSLETAEQSALEAELRCLADDEFVVAERYTEWQVRGPTLEADIAVANIAQDELGHARLWYDLLQEFGYSEVELLWERDPGDFRHSTLVEQPFTDGDWADCVLRGYLYDTYEKLRLDALRESSYPPIAGRVGKILGEEGYHREHAENWIERLSEDPESRERLQRALDRLYPHALTLFEPPAEDARILDLGIRTEPLEALREDWEAIVDPFLAGHGLDVPETAPPAAGRTDHTDAWKSLYNEFTFTYEQLGRQEAPALMPRPEDADV